MECALNLVTLNISQSSLEAPIDELEADHLQTNKVKLFRLELSCLDSSDVKTPEWLHLKQRRASVEEIFIDV